MTREEELKEAREKCVICYAPIPAENVQRPWRCWDCVITRKGPGNSCAEAVPFPIPYEDLGMRKMK